MKLGLFLICNAVLSNATPEFLRSSNVSNTISSINLITKIMESPHNQNNSKEKTKKKYVKQQAHHPHPNPPHAGNTTPSHPKSKKDATSPPAKTSSAPATRTAAPPPGTSIAADTPTPITPNPGIITSRLDVLLPYSVVKTKSMRRW